MYAINQYNGALLPNKTLCFTFDDGPGSHTLSIARYLFEQGIPATFFVVGKYAYHHPEILKQLTAWGHLIGNHTYEHPDMPYYVSVNGNIQDQIMRTDAVIKPYINNTIYFRAPYGKWTPEVAAELNANPLCAVNHLGPIHWDIGGVDCWYWQTGKSVDDALAAYIKDISDKGKGIVVFHDEIADMDYVKPANKTLQLLQQLVPQLKAEGYSFTRLDEIDNIKEASQQKLMFAINTNNGKHLSLSNHGAIAIKGNAAAFTMEFATSGKVIIEVVNHDYLTFAEGSDKIVASAPKNAAALFDYIPVTNNCFMLRATTGHYLAVGANSMLAASAPFMRQAGVFSYVPVNLPVKAKLTVIEKLQLFKKRIAFIKSKLAG